ncbi:MAG: DUF3160 domain-containing protein [Thermoflexaceae bacterium]|nr:DUF3160 domain-containing protein [Thermoflexaceae bacterium]
MKKRVLSIILSITMVLGLTACSQERSGTEEQGQSEKEQTETINSNGSLVRTSFMDYAGEEQYEIVTSPNVPAIQVNDDYSNVINYDEFSNLFDRYEGVREKLEENGFVVINGGNTEFFSLYESNRYSFIPNFITTDAMLHTYHLYFSHLLKTLEREYFYHDLEAVSRQMIEASMTQYEQLKGTAWENAAKRNLAFFSVALKLLDNEAEVDDMVADIVSEELSLIDSAAGITISPLMYWGNETQNDEPLMEDYSQYIVRGYYEEDEMLSRYFKTMMWYGRISFRQSNREETISALLITKAMENCEALESWNRIYDVTAFFAGNSDDPGIYEYTPVMKAVYGNLSVEQMAGNQKKWEEFTEKLKELEPPAINSIPIYEWEERDAAINAFRFMGQRETFDVDAFQRLVYQSVGENASNEKRMLPSALDIPAVFGSMQAEKILREQGDFEYSGYEDNLEKLKKSVTDASADIWKASLYNNWLNTIRPLVEEKGEGYPSFMQNQAWSCKQLNTFLGSFTELKHDSVLYTKQVYAEMGGGDVEEPDYRGYVEPQPQIYARLAALSRLTREGLMGYGMISEEDAENLQRMQELSEKLLVISNKELKAESLTEEEHALIKSFGGQLEHFWYEALKDQSVDGYLSPQEHPAAVVTDIATNPNGSVLEIGTGGIDAIYVIVEVEGSPRIAVGGVYSYYEFEQPLNERLTDKEWRIKLGIDFPEDENGNPVFDSEREKVEQPEWVKEFKVNIN